MGKGSGGGGTTTVQQTTSNLPEYAKPYFTNILERSMYESARPYQAFPGQRIADFSPQESLAMQGIEGLTAAGSPKQFLHASNIAQNIGYGRGIGYPMPGPLPGPYPSPQPPGNVIQQGPYPGPLQQPPPRGGTRWTPPEAPGLGLDLQETGPLDEFGFQTMITPPGWVRSPTTDYGYGQNPDGTPVMPGSPEMLAIQAQRMNEVRDPYGNVIDPNNLPDNMRIEAPLTGRGAGMPARAVFKADYARQPGDPGYIDPKNPRGGAEPKIRRRGPLQQPQGPERFDPSQPLKLLPAPGQPPGMVRTPEVGGPAPIMMDPYRPPRRSLGRGSDIAGRFNPQDIASQYKGPDIDPGYAAGDISQGYQAGERQVGYTGQRRDPIRIMGRPGEVSPAVIPDGGPSIPPGFGPPGGPRGGQFGPGFTPGTVADPQTIERYMSPYQQMVTDIEKREAARQSKIMGTQIGQQAAQTGGLGGYRA